MIRSVIRERIKESLLAGNTVTEVAKEFGMLRPTVAYIAKQLDNEPLTEDKEVLNAQVQLERKNQRLQDTNRIERKVFRESAREFNASEDLFKAVLEKIGEVRVEGVKNEKEAFSEKTGVLIFNDTHIGEVVNLPINTYNLDVARERILSYTKKSLSILKGMGVDNVVICFLGDITNAENHADKLLTNACSRAESLIHAFNIFSEVLVEVSSKVHIEKVYTVMGNEPRLNGELSSLDKVLINNLDYILFEFLRNSFKDIAFDELSHHNLIENVILVGEKKLLITHGIWNARDLGALEKRKDFRGADYAICGHIHAPSIKDRCARGGSLVGANSYSYHNLAINSNIKSGLLLVVECNVTPIIVEV